MTLLTLPKVTVLTAACHQRVPRKPNESLVKNPNSHWGVSRVCLNVPCPKHSEAGRLVHAVLLVYDTGQQNLENQNR